MRAFNTTGLCVPRKHHMVGISGRVAQTRDRTRTDVVVDYAGERFGLDVGYMLSFNFNRRKECGLRRVTVGNRVLWEETV